MKSVISNLESLRSAKAVNDRALLVPLSIVYEYYPFVAQRTIDEVLLYDIL